MSRVLYQQMVTGGSSRAAGSGRSDGGIHLHDHIGLRKAFFQISTSKFRLFLAGRDISGELGVKLGRILGQGFLDGEHGL